MQVLFSVKIVITVGTPNKGQLIFFNKSNKGNSGTLLFAIHEVTPNKGIL